MSGNFDWSGVVQLAAIVLGLIGGVATVPLVNSIKGYLNLKGRAVQVLVAVVSVLVALLTVIVDGTFNPNFVMTSDYVISLFAVVLTASQAEYQRTQKKLEKEGSQWPNH